jgi:hypothetical protein
MLTGSLKKTMLYYSFLVAIILASFFLYSSAYYPLLNSDDALSVLMAHYYKLPNDFYCWGQDRGGTLIPLISQVFIKLFNCSALMAVSLSNYVILILGYIGFSSLFKSRFSKLIFALVLFLPFQRFIDITRFPIGVEYCLIAFAIYLFNKVDQDKKFPDLKNNFLLMTVVMFLIMAVWMSDLAMVSIALLFIIWIIFDYWKNTNAAYTNLVLTYVGLGVLAGFTFISYARGFSTVKVHEYFSMNDLSSVKKAISIVKQAFFDVYTYKTKEILVTVYTYLLSVFILSLLIYTVRKKEFIQLFKNKWISFYFLDFIVVIGVFFTASWVLANNMGRWYFVAGYISMAMVILLSIEHLRNKDHSLRYLRIFLVITVIVGSVSPVITMKYSSPKTLKPTAHIMAEFEQLGEIGIIGEYWNGYICSVTNPDKIKSTPHDQTGSVRNPSLAEDVFKQPKIYIVKDMWLNHFPDTIIQFGHTLLRKGDTFLLGGCTLNEYIKI